MNKKGKWVCKECGNEDYCYYIDEKCNKCNKKTTMIFIKNKVSA